jgi:hypothetical protein
MSRREHMFLRALAVGILVSLHFLPRCAHDDAERLARDDQRMAEESGSAAGAGTASMVLALTP